MQKMKLGFGVLIGVAVGTFVVTAMLTRSNGGSTETLSTDGGQAPDPPMSSSDLSSQTPGQRPPEPDGGVGGNSGITEADFKVYLESRRRLGYFGQQDLDTYAAYDIGVLSQLSSGGDLLASYALYERHLHRIDLESARESALEGIVHGSTRNIDIMANVYVSEAISPREDADDESIRASWLMALAWYEVARIRGDVEMYEFGQDVARREGVTLSSDERAVVAGIAEGLYADLLEERHRLGLQPFENTPIGLERGP